MSDYERNWPVTVHGPRLVLRPLRRRDKAEWMHLRRTNEQWLTPWDATLPAGTGYPAGFGAMVLAQNRSARLGQTLPWVITLPSLHSRHAPIVGQLTVSSIMWGAARSGSIGYWVDVAHAGNGIAPEAVAMATDHCFTALGLHRIEINIRPENGPSLRVVQKLGFRDEGLRKDFLHINGAWADHRSFALTAPEVPDGLLLRLRDTTH
ncbi:GNAT family N-acetyltransferase [Paeniglutamicibacter gangotriensis]|uniref:Ribosomal-protein-alanine N-acetyltransferase n=1 Tax=Paeniglutamicibacter gangotriensis Lz1y TaxID=1276920 RepID=M7NCQ4_9MICC|nr:GNAT family protein [Paeniglutamicibacter gangotriensis]EMQ99599.1 ribosomal-protein-alanine N-acetyltransferase [Paeniglutamicibacter gangotriensis Lz1y]